MEKAGKVTMERVGEQQDGRLWENARNAALMNYLRLEIPRPSRGLLAAL